MSLAFFTRSRTGELLSRVINDVGGVDTVLTSTATATVQNAVTGLAITVALVLLDWKLALLGLLVVPLFLLVTMSIPTRGPRLPTRNAHRLGRKRRAIARRRQGGLTAQLEESLSVAGVLLTKTMLLARPTATEDDIAAACRAARIHDLVAGLPDGYDTLVGERGYRFSGGERQRLAIARMLLRDPPVLILDEATSALDTRTERAVQEALDALARGRTTLVIAHRLATVERADQIVVLHHGEIVERGTHADLLARSGRYAELARTTG
jgi:ABC-type multidrug transport system fused ATPase/permease subunit